MDSGNIYQFNVSQLNGKEINLSAYSNKVLLIVNTASLCGFTPQMTELVKLKEEIGSEDFEILAFPSNDFGNQEPLTEDGLTTFCKRLDVNFPMFNKINVRGPNTHALYQFLADKRRNGNVSARPRWNFHKYLIDRNGVVTDFFYPFTKPLSSRIKKRIHHLLNEPAGKKS
jgi:glutathione peroxidase